MPLVIDEMFAFTTIDENGDEGVMGYKTEVGWLPMVGADVDRIKSLKPMADSIATALRITYKIKRFKYVGEVEDVG